MEFDSVEWKHNTIWKEREREKPTEIDSLSSGEICRSIFARKYCSAIHFIGSMQTQTGCPPLFAPYNRCYLIIISTLASDGEKNEEEKFVGEKNHRRENKRLRKMIDEVCSEMTDDKLASGNDNKQQCVWIWDNIIWSICEPTKQTNTHNHTHTHVPALHIHACEEWCPLSRCMCVVYDDVYICW